MYVPISIYLCVVCRNAMGASAVAYGGSRGSTIYVFQAIEQSPFLEVKQTLPVRSTKASLGNGIGKSGDVHEEDLITHRRGPIPLRTLIRPYRTFIDLSWLCVCVV